MPFSLPDLSQVNSVVIFLGKSFGQVLLALCRLVICNMVQKVGKLLGTTKASRLVVIALEDMLQQHLTVPQTGLMLPSPHVQALVIRLQTVDKVFRRLKYKGYAGFVGFRQRKFPAVRYRTS